MTRDAKPFDYAFYLMGEFGIYLDAHADELSGSELASLQERLARIARRLQERQGQAEGKLRPLRH